MIVEVQTEKLALRRGDRSLFKDFDLRLQKGDALSLTGRNGAGKTTLLRALAGFVRPESGAIRFIGPDGELEAETARASGLHWLGHAEGLKPTRTAEEELVFATQWFGGSREQAFAAADRLGLTPLLGLETRKLSAGQKRRLSLARLVAASRPLWLLDEPLAPLDSQRRKEAGSLMQDHLDAGGLIIAAVHDPLPIPSRPCLIGASL
ncbi:MAG: heme ABC exporter ATP-binding protein CcmA [Asticcacaulis sp.]